MSKKIYVGKLSSKITDEQLKNHFSQVGTVISVNVSKSFSFEKSRYAYVVMSSNEETTKAIQELNNSTLEDSKIHVMEAHSLDQEKMSYYPRRRRSS